MKFTVVKVITSTGNKPCSKTFATPKWVCIWFGCPEIPPLSKVTIKFISCSPCLCLRNLLIYSATTSGSQCEFIPSCSSGWSMTCASTNPRYLALACSSFSLILPSPSKLPFERHNKNRLFYFFRCRIDGTKNMASSSGWAITYRMFCF